MTVRRLVHYEHPGARETPVLLLTSLRDIDPTVELVHAGEDRWWLGAVSDNAERRQRAEMMMAQLDLVARELAGRFERVSPRTVMLCKLNLQGFALIATYFGADPSGTVRVDDGEGSYHCTILEDFRERDAAWRRDRGAENFAARLDESMRGPQRREAEARMKEYLYTDGRDHYGRIMRNRVQVGANGSEAEQLAERYRTSGLDLGPAHLITPAELYLP